MMGIYTMKKLLHRLKNPLFWLLVIFFSVSGTADLFAASRLRILNNKLPPATLCKAYSVNIYADGGVPFSASPNTYKWCVNGTLPTGIAATPSCTYTSPYPSDEATWGAAAYLTLSGTPVGWPAVFSYKLTVAVRDFNDGIGTENNTTDDNFIEKTFILSVNQEKCSASGITITNNSGSQQYYKANGGACTTWAIGANANILPAITSFQAYSDAACNTTLCGAVTSYCGQKTIDVNNNCTTQATGACAYSDN